MRVADKMSQTQVNTGLNKNRGDLQKLQNQAASQKRVITPSDDPVAATRVLKQKTEIQGIDQYLKNITAAKNFLEYSEQSLGEVSDLLVRVKELALSQAGDSGTSAETRAVTATEVEQLFHQAVQVGNRKLGDRFLFGGFRTTQTPFTPGGQYQGDHGEMRIPINKEAKVAINVPGSAIFLGYDLKRRGEATTQPQNEEQLRIPLGLENSKELQVTRAPASDLRLPEFEEQKSQVQTEMQNEFEREVSKEVENELGITVSSKHLQMGAHPRIEQQTKGVNVFKTVDDLRIALQANDKEGVQDTLDLLDSAIEQVVLSRSQLGARVGTLDQTFSSLQRSNVDAKIVKSQAEDVDAFELVTDINKAENTLKTSLHTSSKLLEASLLDFLR